MIFFNLVNRRETYYTANSKKLGDGIKCFDGHTKLPMVAFSELCLNPRVIVMAYPSFNHVVHLNGKIDIIGEANYRSSTIGKRTYLECYTCARGGQNK